MTIASDALIRYIKKHEEYSFERIAGWYCSDRPVITWFSSKSAQQSNP